MTLVKTNITKIEVLRLDFRSRRMQVRVFTDTNSQFEKTFTLTNSDTITKQIFNEVKEHIKKNAIPDSELFFARNIAVSIENDEESQKKISFFISKLIEKTSKLNHTTDPKDYMNLFNDVTDIHILKI